MPGMDGIELQRRLKDADPDLIVLMMTGYGTVETAVQALKNGAYDYLTKPVDPDELSHTVESIVEPGVRICTCAKVLRRFFPPRS